MDAIVLAGGFGTRLRPLTYTCPKPLLPVAGRPLVEWVLDRLPEEVDHVILTVNWRAAAIRAWAATADLDGRRITIVEETEPLGTAGACRNARDHIVSEDFLFVFADILSRMDLADLVRQHRDTGAVGTVALKEVPMEETVHFGVVALADDPPTRILRFVEKPATPDQAPSPWINAGVYCLRTSVLDRVPEGRLVSMEKEVFPDLLGEGLHGWKYEGPWLDVGDPERLRQAARMVVPGGTGVPDDAVIADDAVITDSVAGPGLEVGAGARVERCVLGRDVTVAPGAVVVDCIVGDGEAVTGTVTGTRIWSREVPAGYPEQQVGNAIG